MNKRLERKIKKPLFPPRPVEITIIQQENSRLKIQGFALNPQIEAIAESSPAAQRILDSLVRFDLSK